MKKIKIGDDMTWIDIKNPSKEDIQYLKRKYNFHDLILNELIPPSQRAKVEQFDKQLYLVLHFPVFNKKTRETRLRELDIIIGKNIIITSHYKTILPLKALFTKCNLYEDAKLKNMGQGPAMLLYYIINNLLDALLPKLDHITEKIDKIEDKIFKGYERAMVTEISIVKRDILNMAKSIKPKQSLINSLEKNAGRFFGKKYKIYFQDLSGSYEHVRGVLDNQQEIINSLHQTNESLLSNKISDIMKILTVISFITFPLGVIAGIFGMNVFGDVSFAQNPITFWVILGLMITMAGSMFGVFKKKKWL